MGGFSFFVLLPPASVASPACHHEVLVSLCCYVFVVELAVLEFGFSFFVLLRSCERGVASGFSSF